MADARALSAVTDLLRPAWVEVDLDAIIANHAHLRRASGDRRTVAVVKADAYGHGAVPVARALERAGADTFAVAMVEEGAELRRGGVERPILVLGPSQAPQIPLFHRYRLTPVLSGVDQVVAWAEAAEGWSGVREVHLELDTGMGRLGIPLPDLSGVLARLRAARGLALAGLMSHLAESDDLESPRTGAQLERFATALAALEPAERERAVVHLANSAGTLHHPAARHQMVRLGLGLYGLDPARRDEALRPAMTVRARVVQLRDVAPGDRIGYNGRWEATRPSRIGILPLGYADGYAWRLANRAEAIAAGRRVPVAGAVSMDLTAVDLTEAPVGLGDEVTLLGGEGEAAISAWELARWGETIPYEVLTRFGQRLARRERAGGRLEGVTVPRAGRATA